ncbi:hypothetical protein E2562_035502 [Oryza meyeriana var. granulata]|uniref:Uncharacterized protein n=1 Tax=Oryza meyeriana var. granulata TaxID=110450 RepID=A0A6G1ESM2_9ORYZ|nr:hypothetical protein E2562_035502 [Oryza meyeriana var. granulata]KAF0927656.1 hypothetical protein E2562_035502 [Oryza meyeriana var. granulata]KAF0927658.1 hypothetical protein E2562_035502 [Oryza meyeriana var. granulata]
MSFPGRGDQRPPNGFVWPLRASTPRPVTPRSSATLIVHPAAMALPHQSAYGAPVLYRPSTFGVRISSPPSASVPAAPSVAALAKEALKKLLEPQTALAPAAAATSEAEDASHVDLEPPSSPSPASSSAPSRHQLPVPAAPVFSEPPSAAGLDDMVEKTPFVCETALAPPGAAGAADLDLAPISNKGLARSVRPGLGNNFLADVAGNHLYPHDVSSPSSTCIQMSGYRIQFGIHCLRIMGD